MYTTNRFVLQELGILLGGCLTVMNEWGYSQEMRGSVMLSTNHLKAHSKFYQPHSQVIVQLKSNFFKLRNSWLT